MTTAHDLNAIQPEIVYADEPGVWACTFTGTDAPKAEHDYRPYVYTPTNARHLHPVTVLRCVWCHVVACGSAEQNDPCIEPAKHKGHHRTRLGMHWPQNKPRPKKTQPWPERENL